MLVKDLTVPTEFKPIEQVAPGSLLKQRADNAGTLLQKADPSNLDPAIAKILGAGVGCLAVRIKDGKLFVLPEKTEVYEVQAELRLTGFPAQA
jgi:hypothetical protein